MGIDFKFNKPICCYGDVLRLLCCYLFIYNRKCEHNAY